MYSNSLLSNKASPYHQLIKSFFALFLGVFLLGTQLNAQSISDVVPSLNSVVGLTGLPVTNVVKKSNSISGDVTIHGKQSLLVGFKVNGKSMGAVLFHQGITLGDVVLSLKGKPTDDIELKKVVFIFVPPANAQKNVAVSSLPTPVQHMIDSSVTTINLHKGLNVFSQAGVKDGSKLETMLKKVHAYKDSYSLIGTLSPKLFSRNSGTDIKNEILDGLDIHIGLPKLSFPGLPKAVTIKNSKLTITAPTVEGKREIDLSVNGDLVAKIGNQEIDLNYEVDFKKQKGKPTTVLIKGKSKKGEKLTLSFASVSMTLLDMDFKLNKKGKSWGMFIEGDTKFRNKTVKLQVTHKNNSTTALMYPKMTLAEAMGDSNIPGLDKVNVSWITLSKDSLLVTANIKGESAQIVLFKEKGNKHLTSVIYVNKFSPDIFIPDAKNTPLKDVTFEKLTFIHNSSKNSRKFKVASNNNVQYYLGTTEEYITLKPGLNLFGHMNIKPEGEIAKLLKKVGVTDLRLPLNGIISPKMFTKNHTASVKKELLAALDLHVKLPALDIPEIDKVLTFHNGQLAITGKGGIDISVSGDADLKIRHEAIPFYVDVNYKKSDLSFSGHTEHKWVHPMGIKFLTLDSLKLNIDKKKNKSGKKELDISIEAKTDIGKHTRLDINVAVEEVNGKIVDASFELDGPLKLSEIPGVKNIPHASHFEIGTIKITEHGIEAKTDFGGKKDLDIFAFDHSGWNLIVRQDNFAITEIITPLKNTPLKHIVLSEAALVISQSGLHGKISDFSEIGQDGLKDIYGKNAQQIDVNSGLNLISVFEHKNAGGKLPDAFKRMGMTQEKVILTGDIGGIFGGPVKLNIKANLDAHGSAKNQPKWMKSKPNAEAFFSLIATDTGGQFDIEIGMGTQINAKVHGTELLFDAKVALEFEDEKIDIKIIADLKDNKGWKKPFGIPGFTLYEVGMDVGIAEDGAIHLGFDGNIKVSGDKYSIKADADLLPEAVGAPQDIAFIGSASKVDMFFMEEIAVSMIGENFKIDIPKGILPTFTDVKFAFVTPGAQDPDLHITGEGFALAGGMNWLAHDVGDMNVSVSPTKGIQAAGKIDDFKLAGILDLKDNDFTMDIGVKTFPNIKVDSNIEFLGLKEKVKVDFSKKGVTLDADLKVSSYLQIKTDFSLSGIDISAKHPKYKKADLALSADLSMDLEKFIIDPATSMLTRLANDINKAFVPAEKALTKAQNKVDRLTTQLNAQRAKIRKERAKVEEKVQDAENRVNILENDLNNQWSKYHRCHGWFDKWPCRIKHGLEIAGLEVAKETADEALNLAKELVDHFPIDLDPTIALIITARDTATGLLDLAKAAVKGADVMAGFIKEGMKKITDGMGDHIDLKRASFSVDTRKFIEDKTPIKANIDALFFGKSLKAGISMKVAHIEKDLSYDLKQMELLAAYALHYAVKNGIDHIPGPLRDKIKSAVAGNFEKIHKANEAELKKNNFSSNEQTTALIEMRADYDAYNQAYLVAQVAKQNPLNSEKSKTFTNELIEVGHTGLCLDNINGRITQVACQDKSTKWSTSSASGAPGVVKGTGFVYIKDQDGNCMYPNGTWADVTKTFNKMPFTTDAFTGNSKLSLGQCVNTKEYYWKVLKHGDDWMQIANLATNECLHFDDSNAIAGKATATWKPCVGSANQVYRIADNTTPVYHKADIALRNDQIGKCIGEANSDKVVSMVECSKAAKYDYMVNISGNVKFINRKTGNCLKPSGYAVGAQITEVACTQLDYQWWNVKQFAGGMTMKNAQTGLCAEKSLVAGENQINQVDCSNNHNSIFTPTKHANEGPNWATVSNRKVPTAHKLWTYSNAYLCSYNAAQGFLTGTIDFRTFQCNVARYNDLMLHKSDYKIMIASSGMRWAPYIKHTSGTKLPKGAIITGAQDNSIPTYTCMTNIKGTATPVLGWTLEGKLCNTAAFGRVDAYFDVLSRVSSYKLDLD